jgi:hypothetical protein
MVFVERETSLKFAVTGSPSTQTATARTQLAARPTRTVHYLEHDSVSHCVHLGRHGGAAFPMCSRLTLSEFPVQVNQVAGINQTLQAANSQAASSKVVKGQRHFPCPQGAFPRTGLYSFTPRSDISSIRSIGSPHVFLIRFEARFVLRIGFVAQPPATSRHG